MSENLSNPNFSAANSERNDLYFLSVFEVRFDANAIGCLLFTDFPFGSTVWNLCASTAPNASAHPSVVITKFVPSYFGFFSTGPDVSTPFNLTNASSCSLSHLPSSLCAVITLLYTAFDVFSGISTSASKSLNGFSIIAYPFTKSLNHTANPRNLANSNASSGFLQFTIAPSLLLPNITLRHRSNFCDLVNFREVLAHPPLCHLLSPFLLLPLNLLPLRSSTDNPSPACAFCAIVVGDTHFTFIGSHCSITPAPNISSSFSSSGFPNRNSQLPPLSNTSNHAHALTFPIVNHPPHRPSPSTNVPSASLNLLTDLLSFPNFSLFLSYTFLHIIPANAPSSHEHRTITVPPIPSIPRSHSNGSACTSSSGLTSYSPRQTCSFFRNCFSSDTEHSVDLWPTIPHLKHSPLHAPDVPGLNGNGVFSDTHPSAPCLSSQLLICPSPFLTSSCNSFVSGALACTFLPPVLPPPPPPLPLPLVLLPLPPPPPPTFNFITIACSCFIFSSCSALTFSSLISPSTLATTASMSTSFNAFTNSSQFAYVPATLSFKPLGKLLMTVLMRFDPAATPAPFA
ncbi:hypothetical protein EST38_g13967, partial [Candolleomyces aberdarensis]